MSKHYPVDVGDLHRRAQVVALSGLSQGRDAVDIVAAISPTDVPGRFTPDVALLELAVTALDLACSAAAQPLEYEGLRERHLPEITFRGRVEHRNSQYALYAAACMRGGLKPDLFSDAGWWQSPLWQYALYAVVVYSRAAADRLPFRWQRSPGGSPPGTASSSRRDPAVVTGRPVRDRMTH